ncbi:hypothetical protein WI822_04265 [Salmonella enterica subsp. enterica serovar Corvallis]
MARPLRKLTREGVVYARREIVEAEINEFLVQIVWQLSPEIINCK